MVYSSDSEAKGKRTGAPYYCLVSTLNPKGTQWAYRYQAFDLQIPKGWIHQARKNELDKKWVTVRIADKGATARTEADSVDRDAALVRMARCRLPDSPKIIAKVKQNLQRFGSTSWVNKQEKTKKGKEENSTSDAHKVGATCTTWLVTYICNEPNVSDPSSDPGCVETDRDCIIYEHFDDISGPSGGDSGGGGGSSSGGDSADMCQPDDSGGGLGFQDSDGVPVSCEPDEEETVEIILDPTFEDTKAECVYNKLNQSANSFFEVVSEFAGEDTQFDLKFEVGPIPQKPSALGAATKEPTSNNQFRIIINSTWLPNNASLDVARILLHEGIHAELSRKVASIGGPQNLDGTNFLGIYDYYRRYYKNWSHEQMAAHYRNIIVQGMKEFDNSSHSNQFYEDLAWRGLEETTSWDQLISNADDIRISETYQELLDEPGSTQCN